MAEDFRKIYMYQLTNVPATNVRVSERNFRDISVVPQDFLPEVSKSQLTNLMLSLEKTVC